jgi:protein phosphatase PTC7
VIKRLFLKAQVNSISSIARECSFSVAIGRPILLDVFTNFLIDRYQLTVVPDNYPNRANYVTDLPKDGDRKSFFLRNGDLIVLATDGYFDNVYAHETLQIVNAHMNQLPDTSNNEDAMTHIRTLAKLLTDAARRLSLDPKRLSPWAKGARAHGGHYRGGKVDDITCIVTMVQQTQNNHQDPE